MDTKELVVLISNIEDTNQYVYGKPHILFALKAYLDLLQKLREPTEEMIEAAIAVTDCDSEAIRHNLVQEFKAMIKVMEKE